MRSMHFKAVNNLSGTASILLNFALQLPQKVISFFNDPVDNLTNILLGLKT